MSKKRLGAFSIAAKFEVPEGVTALFGPSGSGKTSIVNMVAGLLTPDRGRISVNGTLLFDSAGGFSQPPHHRHIGYVFPGRRLFPHMTVAQNLDYGAACTAAAGRSRRARTARQHARHRPICWAAGPASSPAASASVSPSAARCCCARGCCCSTSRSPRSMRAQAPRSSRIYCACARRPCR
jgi:energy-coupling factor transporter ATP-binding protein EcfA2